MNHHLHRVTAQAHTDDLERSARRDRLAASAKPERGSLLRRLHARRRKQSVAVAGRPQWI